jgi:hypothetical protein
MLAEIFLLRMEAIYRASEESAPTGNSRFVPIMVPRSSPRLLWVTQQSRDFKDAYDSPKKPSRKEASKASKKKDKPASKVQRPQTAEKKLPTSDTTEAPKPQDVEQQSVPSQPTPSRLRTLWPEAPPTGAFSR